MRQNAGVIRRLTERKEWQFFGVLPRAAPGLAAVWWVFLILRGILPAAFGIAMGVLVGALIVIVVGAGIRLADVAVELSVGLWASG